MRPIRMQPGTVLFLSTPSARRATLPQRSPARRKPNFYPRPPRGGRRRAFLQGRLPIYFYPRPPRGGRHEKEKAWEGKASISIHALREEGDKNIVTCNVLETDKFLSTPSARRATKIWSDRWSLYSISIHALREEGDTLRHSPSKLGWHFYPRPPRGGRPARQRRADRCAYISIHALREEGDSMVEDLPEGWTDISIHALREEGDQQRAHAAGTAQHFYPRPPRGGRHPEVDLWYTQRAFLSTPSARRATCCASMPATTRVFLSTPSARRATSLR